jgi:hypothetical protein
VNLGDLQNRFPLGVWLLDTEYATPLGDPVIPVCVVAREFFSHRSIRQWFDPALNHENPFPIGGDALFVAYAAQAEWSCFLSLGWELPLHILDLYAEFRNEISGRTPPPGRNSYDSRLIGAMEYYGFDSISAAEKKEMQERISLGHPFTAEERAAILDYCESDVVCLEKLLPAMATDIELPYALFRGRYSKAVARIERAGIPVDRCGYDRLVRNRERLKSRLIDDFESNHGPAPYIKDRNGIHKFSFKRLSAYLNHLGLLHAWRKTPKHRLSTNEEYLQEMACGHGALRPLADLVKRIGDLRQFGLTVGSDGRARYPVMPFKGDTGRNYPKARRFLFAQSSWTRGFIMPPPGEWVGYIDWSAAEFSIAAALSQDAAMLAAYQGGDPYLQSAISMGFAPQGATKQTHGTIRDVIKVWLLSAQYGATAISLENALPPELATTMPDPLASAAEFLEKHHRVYSRYWEWAEKRVELFVHETHLEETIFGWRHRLNTRLKQWQVRNQSLNFPMQSTCAEILRWACIYATEGGIEVSAPVHDALLVGGKTKDMQSTVVRARACMDRASELVLGFAMRTDVKIVTNPDRFIDPRGMETWRTIARSLDTVEKEQTDGVQV